MIGGVASRTSWDPRTLGSNAPSRRKRRRSRRNRASRAGARGTSADNDAKSQNGMHTNRIFNDRPFRGRGSACMQLNNGPIDVAAYPRASVRRRIRARRCLMRLPAAASRVVRIIGLDPEQNLIPAAAPIQLRIAAAALTRPSTVAVFQDAAVRFQTDVVIRTVKYVSDERPRGRAKSAEETSPVGQMLRPALFSAPTGRNGHSPTSRGDPHE